MQIVYNGCTQLASASVTSAASQLQTPPPANQSGTGGQSAITIPLQSVTGYLYVLVTPTNNFKTGTSTTVDAAYLANYGVRYSSSDKVATIQITDQQSVWVCSDSASYSIYPTRWY